MQQPVYLDYNSTTPVDPQVIDAMLPYFHEIPGNTGSSHKLGRQAEEALEDARENVAELINVKPSEITFSSGATESLNIAIQGIFNNSTNKNHIITSSTEHPAVLECCEHLAVNGAELTILKVNSEGEIDINELSESVKKNTCLIAIMWANNETGVINPVASISEIAQKNKIPFVCDATQAVGKIQVDAGTTGVGIMAFSAHKFYGPKGVGALYIDQKYQHLVRPLSFGGGQERGLRPGTLNVPGVAGLGAACALAFKNLDQEYKRISQLRNDMEARLLQFCECEINGTITNRLPNTSNISFNNIEAQLLLESLYDHVALATGSACSSNNAAPSHVLKAMGKSADQIIGSVRISLGKYTTEEEILYTTELLKERVEALRLTTFEEN